jgi:signal transduction histidine kinase
MKDRQDGLLTITSQLKYDMIAIEFTDNGPGISQDVIAHIFEPFFTTKPEGEGTGLGLSIAYGIAQAHGGVIEVNSHPGEGARFTILLPSVQES